MFDNVDTKGTFIFTYAIPLLTFTITPDVIYEDVKALLLTVNLLFIELRRSEEKNENIQMVGMDVIFAAYAADHQYINCS